MRSNSSHVRAKVIVLLVSMTALWVFAAVVTLREGMNLLFVSTLDTGLGRPTESLVDALQHERKLSVVALSSAASGQRQDLLAGRARTDEVLASWRDHVSGGKLDFAASDLLKTRISEASAELDKLSRYRNEIDTASVDRTTAVAAFTNMIDAGFRIYGSISSLDDQEIAKEAHTLVALSRARELLSQEDSLVAGALAAGSFTAQDITEFTKLVGAQRFLYASTAVDLPPDDLTLYQQAVAGTAVTRLRGLEDMVIQKAKPGTGPGFSAATWADTIDPAARAMRDLELAAADHTIARATPAAIGVIVRLALAGGLGLIAVIAAVVISITTTRSLVQQLEKLREAARDLSENRLPKVVERLSLGENVDVAAEAPPLSFGNDEIGQVGQSFNAVQETAIRAAVQQAELRRGVRDVFLSLARRTQNLVHKQLSLLDAMERRADADEMEDLFRIDHLATRMRRNAENLIVLSGATPGRTWRRWVPMIDVVRGALAEVEDYTRVTLLPVEPSALAGRAVGDVIHLLAELIENAVSFSPPYTVVNVSGQAVANGFVVEIEDRGLGMSDADLATANEQLLDPPDFSLADTSRLGHYVVARLAQRHGIRIHLRHSPYGGTVAIVLIPASLMVETDDNAVATPGLPSRVLHHAEPARPAVGSPAVAVLEQRQSAIALPGQAGLHRRERKLPELDAAAAPAPRLNGSAETTNTIAETTNVSSTPAGLPWRVRQASLAPQLVDSGGPADESIDDEEPTLDPELVRRKMSSFQLGTRRGRTDAAGDTAAGQREGDETEGEDHPNVSHDASREHPGDRQEG